MSPQSSRLLDRITSRSATVGVVGLGYVGLPLAVTAAKQGYAVRGFDVDQEKIDRIAARKSYIGAVEDLDLVRAWEAGRFDATTDFAAMAACDAIIICVPTPLTRHREPDLSFVETTTREIAAHMRDEALVVLESTTYPGTTRDVVKPILERSGKSFHVGFSPEREDPGNPNFRTATIPKIVAGEGAEAGTLVRSLYQGIVDEVVEVADTPTAEAIKITENIYRSVNIALVNELKMIYDRMGIDVWNVIDGAATKPFGFQPFYPGPGLGGHCIPIDPFYLSWKTREFGMNTRFIELAGEINTSMPHHVVSRAAEALDRARGKGLNGASVLVVGASYKKNVADVRESPSMRIMEAFSDRGSSVSFHDPHIPEIPQMRSYPEFVGMSSVSLDGCERYDLIVIATDHDIIDYAALGRAAEDGSVVVDTRNVFARKGLNPELVTKA